MVETAMGKTKYELETIPIWDAYDADTECPLCLLAERADKRYVEFFLGSSVMSPDIRVQVNESGFCPSHFEKLFSAERNRHGLGLLSHTHLVEVRRVLEKSRKGLEGGKGTSTSKLKKHALAHVERLRQLERSCLICDRLDYTLKRYTFTIVYLWQTKEDFAAKLRESKGFCLHHLPYVLEMAAECIGGHKYAELLELLVTLQDRSFARLEPEILWYTQKFDYQNAKKPWGTSKDALNRVLQKLTGIIMHERSSQS